ncbi:hypothetical protein Bca52824_004378 [Brassica carinata]|uniref:Uncharacterized protein n=1 Tax=Brassica carinata TaxID=52824 RepID=A0A8X7WLR8_BRACI|nr:hypothetical protein Bca52824_004378 [Brassica carinata]
MAEEKCSINLAKIKSKPSALEPIKKQNQDQNSLSLRRWGSSSGKQGRQNCLCSPTTHAGSFRCRHHRFGSLTRAGSLGSNFTVLLSSKSNRFSASLKAQ